MARTRLFKSGNSQAVRIPPELAYANMNIDLEATRFGDVITIFPARNSLNDVLAALRGRPTPPAVRKREAVEVPGASRAAETLIFRASLTRQVYRAFEIADTSSLYALAQAIVRSFDFDFDHAFGFYSNLKGNIYQSPVRYELFVDMGESDGEAQSVKRTRVVEAFTSVGTKMRFLFDYGDGWEFLVELVERKPKEPKIKLPRLVKSVGKAPEQYPDPEDE